jgi:hypothetical protein
MKVSVPIFLMTLSLWASGCVTEGNTLVLDAVGPAPAQPAAVSQRGTLVVFSAFDVHADFTAVDPDRRRHTDYKLLSSDGKFVRLIHNNPNSLMEGPVEVGLAPGEYKVVARCNGCGVVTVPVVVEPNRTTTVHLEGGASLPRGADTVQLPDGQIIGWRAKSAAAAK